MMGASLLKSRLVLVLATVVLAGVAVVVWPLGGRGRLDRRTRDILASATKVEVFRIDGKEIFFATKPRPAGERRVGGYLVIAQGQDQGKEFADKLAGILEDEKTYSKDRADCFRPGLAFRVLKNDEVVEVLICFMCDNFYCGPPKDPAEENASFHGSPRRSDLVRLAKEAFPNDKEIQELKDKPVGSSSIKPQGVRR